MKSPADPISVVTAAAYPMAGVAIGELSQWSGEAWVMFFVLLFLGAGTAAHHWTGLSDRFGRDWDQAGMVATYTALGTAAVAGPLWMWSGAVLAVILTEVRWDIPYHGLIGAAVWIAIAAGFSSGIVWMTASGVVAMACGIVLQPGHDFDHGLWHLCTALGTALLYLSFP